MERNYEGLPNVLPRGAEEPAVSNMDLVLAKIRHDAHHEYIGIRDTASQNPFGTGKDNWNE